MPRPESHRDQKNTNNPRQASKTIYARISAHHHAAAHHRRHQPYLPKLGLLLLVVCAREAAAADAGTSGQWRSSHHRVHTSTMSAPSLQWHRASAPGKLILFGEHAVVYNKTAVASCLSDLRVFASVVRASARGARGVETAARHAGADTGALDPCRCAKP